MNEIHTYALHKTLDFFFVAQNIVSFLCIQKNMSLFSERRTLYRNENEHISCQLLNLPTFIKKIKQTNKFYSYTRMELWWS